MTYNRWSWNYRRGGEGGGQGQTDKKGSDIFICILVQLIVFRWVQMVYYKRTTVSKVTGGGVQYFPGDVQFYQEEGGGGGAIPNSNGNL